jgi:hypothetical protein
MGAGSIPLLAYLGLETIAKPPFFASRQICAQIPSPSLYAFRPPAWPGCALPDHLQRPLCEARLLFVASRKRLPGLRLKADCC